MADTLGETEGWDGCILCEEPPCTCNKESEEELQKYDGCQYCSTRGKAYFPVCTSEECREKHILQEKQKLVENTFLSDRESELYIWKNQIGYSIAKSARQMEISENNAYGKVDRIRKKIEKAEKTAELSL